MIGGTATMGAVSVHVCMCVRGEWGSRHHTQAAEVMLLFCYLCFPWFTDTLYAAGFFPPNRLQLSA